MMRNDFSGELSRMAAIFCFTRQDGGDEQSNEDERADLFKASGFGGVVVNLFGNNLRGDNAVEQPAGRQ